jgi:hypothetical protein
VDWASRTKNGLPEVPIVLHVIFFLWGWEEEEVCRAGQRTLDELKQQIGNTFAAESLEFLRKSVTPVFQVAGLCVKS